ncbi:hypothetical protein [Sphingomonas bacterium]|uniref:hypothetical protein n=1 Tax=Sphingomonas bacterium TaxID=1895847 RepID=UPI0015750DCE|nr:hypothetical protein [Sphingomonas bacterium]
MAFEDIKNNPQLGKSMAKWAALGAVIAIPLPFVGPIIGATVGAGIGYVRGKKA